VEPNPRVGCIIVKHGKIIGCGWHRNFGGPHAEVDALNAASESTKGASMYVNLEPCNHTGKTPPCTDAVMRAGIRRVVIGMEDPNPMVAGAGIARLRMAGIECIVDVERDECVKLNERYIVNITLQRPFVILKAAVSIDGFIAPLKGPSRWISGAESRELAHTLRAQVDAVLIGSGTLRKDNPVLTVRKATGENPVRIIVTTSYDFPPGSAPLTDEDCRRSIVLTSRRSAAKKQAEVEKLKMRGIRVLEAASGPQEQVYLPSALKLLYRNGINSVLVEGGARIFSSFLGCAAVDRLELFMAPKVFGAGLSVFANARPRHIMDAHKFKIDGLRKVGDDAHIVMRPIMEK